MTTLRTPDPPVAPEAAARVRRRDRPAGRRRRNQSEAFVFLTPWLLGAVALTVGPMVVSLYLSFTDYDMFTAPRLGRLRQPHAHVHRRRPLPAAR